MSISKVCTSCKHHNPITVAECRKCSSRLREDRFKVRVKKTMTGSRKHKWITKTVTLGTQRLCY